MLPDTLPPFGRDVLARALAGTLESPGESLPTLAFAGICAIGYWWLRCRREGRAFLSLPSGWKQATWDAICVTTVALAILFVPHLVKAAYERDAALRAELRQASNQPTQSGQTVLTENPDHAGQLAELGRTKEQNETLQKERDIEKIARQTAEGRVVELEGNLREVTQQQTQCDRLATLSGTGRQLVNKLFATRAALETRREIDKWYQSVCGAMSKPQCEAFLAAPRKSDAWAGYPAEDGGYSQTLRGRSEYLSDQLSTLCR